MDILKKALSTPSKCNFTSTHISIDNFSLPRDTAVPLSLSRQYTLDQLCFYLINSDLAYTEYLKKCKSAGILQVSYIDQKKLVEEVKRYKSVSTVISFDPLERHRREGDYSFVERYPLKKGSYKIIVPNSYQSLLNMKNAKKFLEKGVFRREKVSLDENPELMVLDRFAVCQDGVEDWDSVVAVFLDGSKWQYKDWKWVSLKEIVKNVATFFLYSRDGEEQRFEDLDVMAIKIDEEGKLSENTFKVMWRKINSKANQK